MLTRKNTATFAAMILVLCVAAGMAHAQSSLGLGTSEPVMKPSGLIAYYAPWFQHVLSYINREQQGFYRLLTGSLKAMRENPWQLTTLIGLSFAYGVFHAAGPGHGKAVISSYMIANETELKRGVVISFLAAMAQGSVAILLVGAGFLVLHGTAVTVTDATWLLETLSFGAITLFGLYLLFTKFRSLMARPAIAGHQTAPHQTIGRLAMAGHHHADHHHGHVHHDHDHQVHHHHHHGAGQVCETCGHAHAPAPETLGGERFSLRDGWTAILAVGLRPCSGALIVLTFSFLNGLILGGILSVIAMSIGTAITVSVLATLAVLAKDWAVRIAGEGSAGLRVGNAIEILGAVLVTLFGFTLLMASLQA